MALYYKPFISKALRYAGSSHQNWARPTEFSSCRTDRLELSSSTPAFDTD